MRYEKQEVVEAFLREVNEQIVYQPMHAAVDEELRAHMEDKAQLYMEYGLSAEEAYQKAVRDMGDASTLGVEMNRTHHLRIAKPLLFLILSVTLFLGLGGNVLYRRSPSLEDLYFIWGSLVLVAVMYYGYPFLLKYSRLFLTLFGTGVGVLVLLSILLRIGNVSWFTGIGFSPFSPSVHFGVLQVAILAAVVLLYQKRKNSRATLLGFWLFQAVLLLLMKYFRMSEYSYVPTVTMIISCLFLSLYMVKKGYLAEKKGNIPAILAGFVVLLLLFAGLQGERLGKNLRAFVNPEKQALTGTAWDDSYNNVLIRELLSKAKPVGKISLTEEELQRYLTAQWYYEDGNGEWSEEYSLDFDSYVKYRMQFAEDLELEGILPQHAQNNYRIAVWILKYG